MPSTTDATPTSVTLEWAAVPAGGDGGSAVTGHKLEFDRGDGRGLCHVYGGAEARFTVAGLVPGTSYSTRVCAENQEGYAAGPLRPRRRSLPRCVRATRRIRDGQSSPAPCRSACSAGLARGAVW